MKQTTTQALTAAAVWLLCLLHTQPASAYVDHRNAKVDSAEQVISSGKPISDKDLMGCYNILIRGYLGKDTEKHDHYARQMLALTYKMNALNMRENALNHLGLQYYGQERYEEAEPYFLWAIAVTDSMRGDSRYTEADIDDNYSQLYGALGNLYNMQDKALLAIEYYQKALPIFERHGWLESQTILHHNTAELWLSMSNHEKAEAEYLKAIATGEASGDSLMSALPRKGLVKIYLDKGDYEKARQTIGPAYDYYRAHQQEETNDYPEVLASMARLHLMEGHVDIEQARKYVGEAIRLDTEELGGEVRRDIYTAAAMIAIKDKNWRQALQYAERSVHENDEEATFDDVECYELLAQIHIELGNKAKALLYINKVREMMERFATKHYQSSLSQMEVLYETKEKEAEIAQLTKERRWLLWGGLLTALVLLLTALVFFLLWQRVRQKRQTALIQARLDGEVSERVRIARDLHDRLGGLLTALKLRVDDPLIDEAIREMRNVSHHLLPDSLSRYGLRTALRDFCATMERVSFSFVGEERHIAHEEALYCIVHELVNNAVKSAQAQHIRVQLLADEDYTAVNVSDDGIGLNEADIEQGTGLSGIRQRVAAIGGTLDIAATPGEGTEINIEIKHEKKDD
ncbi:MAG: hypothetical protein IJ067_07585 [Prevotella sp.]|nr:hypothetical protein [Prevotella sp.]